MSAAKKAILGIAIFVGVLFLALAGGYLVLAGLMPKFGEAIFRESYDRANHEYPVLGDTTLAGSFGGSCGLRRLSRLRSDPSISLVGRARAGEVILYIESGRHVADLEKEIKDVQSRGMGMPPFYRYAQFVIWHDRARGTK